MVNKERVGEVVIDAHTSLVLEDKSTARQFWNRVCWGPTGALNQSL
jgi:hypothetical protein